MLFTATHYRNNSGKYCKVTLSLLSRPYSSAFDSVIFDIYNTWLKIETL